MVPEMAAARRLPGCIYYAFAQDLADANAYHLVEGWKDEAFHQRYEKATTFLQALATVVKNARILNRLGVRYDVTLQHVDDPRGKVA
ncbi:putative quinol monooxygenase [Kosakonia sacchari]